MPDMEQQRRAAWSLQLGVHGALSGLFTRALGTYIEPDAVVLGDLDNAEMILNEARGVLWARHPDLVTQVHRGLDHARAGRASAAIGDLLAAWGPLSRLSGGDLDLPRPRAGRPSTRPPHA